jgi:hypothetical protein
MMTLPAAVTVVQTSLPRAFLRHFRLVVETFALVLAVVQVTPARALGAAAEAEETPANEIDSAAAATIAASFWSARIKLPPRFKATVI